ncbi:phosphoglycerate mutase [Malaciobacter pacificus]|uniref:Phosphohistidine phosphatase n=1 Tax=Malaciobacter pacificus TaxID=1080223 RepID=A0A5C2HBT4_9BACT|nr:histidine phosphatase family protein [Malaciobacter pacificus]QEP34985.1 phosphohistidine phosphatase [Malaciobacter pacificus]GGD42507.1 phosphoglycerate mutase [Malaciobacter pacificus]
MKKLYIVRHTQKEDINSNTDDYDRELSKEGIESANAIAQLIANKNEKIDLIVASPAIRTRTTAEIIAKEINYRKAVMYNEVLYMAFVNELLETITYTFDTVNTMVLVGHNPSLTALAVTLVGFKEKFEMGAIMEIVFDCDTWIEVSKENAKLISYEIAKV